MEHRQLLVTTDKVYFGCAVINIICQTIYFISLVPGGDQRQSQYQEFSIDTDPLLQRMTHSSYGGFHVRTNILRKHGFKIFSRRRMIHITWE